MKGGHDEQTAIQRTKTRPEGPRKGPAFLTVISGEMVGTVFELPLGATLIGRSEVAQVRLPDDGVSRRHAKIVREADGSAKIVDLESTNGTYINGRRVHAEGLREGDRIRIGQSATLDFRYEYRESSVVGGSRESVDVPVPTLRRETADVPVALPKRPPSDTMRGGYENLAGAFDSLGKVYGKQGQQNEAAIATYRRTLQIREVKFGKEHPAVASILDSLGAALQDAGEPAEALDHHQRALLIYEAQPRPPRETGHVLAHIGRCLLSLGRGNDALAAFERSHAMLRSQGASSAELARVRFGMAQALMHLGRERDRMLDLARLARDAFAAGGTTTRELYAEVRRWLQSQGEG